MIRKKKIITIEEESESIKIGESFLAASLQLELNFLLLPTFSTFVCLSDCGQEISEIAKKIRHNPFSIQTIF